MLIQKKNGTVYFQAFDATNKIVLTFIDKKLKKFKMSINNSKLVKIFIK